MTSVTAVFPGPFGGLPFGWLPGAWDFGTPDVFKGLLAAGGNLTYLLVADPYDPKATGEALALPGPFGTVPFGWSPEFEYLGVGVPARLASRNYLSKSTDSLPNVAFPGVLDPAYSVTASLGVTSSSPSSSPLGGADISVGDITIRNGAGLQDALINRSWGGRVAEILAGVGTWSFDQFATVLRGNISGLRGGDMETNLSLAARLDQLNNAVTRSYFGGTGDADGPATLANQAVPEVWGRCRNVPMIQVDAGNQIYRVALALSAVLLARDKGLEVTDSGADYADFAALTAATVAAGHYATCLALGLIRFGSTVTTPTADVDGPSAIGTTAPDIIQYLAKTRLDPNLVFDVTDIDGGTFNTVKAARGWTVGFYLDSTTLYNGRQIADQLMSNIGGWIMAARDGALQLGVYAKPTASPTTLTSADIDASGPTLDGRIRATRQMTIGYQPMIKTFTDTDMSSAVTQSDRVLLSTQYRTIVEEAAPPDRDAVAVRIDTSLDSAADAQALADALIDLLSWATHRWKVPLRGLPFKHWLGDNLGLKYDRHGLENGANFIVIGVDETSDPSGQNELTLLGAAP